MSEMAGEANIARCCCCCWRDQGEAGLWFMAEYGNVWEQREWSLTSVLPILHIQTYFNLLMQQATIAVAECG